MEETDTCARTNSAPENVQPSRMERLVYERDGLRRSALHLQELQRRAENDLVRETVMLATKVEALRQQIATALASADEIEKELRRYDYDPRAVAEALAHAS